MVHKMSEKNNSFLSKWLWYFEELVFKEFNEKIFFGVLNNYLCLYYRKHLLDAVDIIEIEKKRCRIYMKSRDYVFLVNMCEFDGNSILDEIDSTLEYCPFLKNKQNFTLNGEIL